jgi:hypothetical protein
MFREESVIDQITVDENGIIFVRRANRIFKDDELVSQSYHRSSFMPGSDLAGQDPKVVAIAQAIWSQ